MNAANPLPIALHEDVALFREALRFTAAETGFISRLIEKDYFCTLVLQHLCESDAVLVFKGGTCLAKVHAGFYRLSEDLDFSISMSTESVRSTRSRAADAFKAAIRAIPARMHPFTIVEPVSGANGSKQYAATETAGARTLLLDPVRGGQMIQAVRLPCMSYNEAMAEKFRAAMTRRDVAIRDFYDIDHATRNLGVDPLQSELLGLIRAKVAVPGNGPVDVSDSRFLALRQQLDAQLKPVLRGQDFTRFELDRAFDVVRAVAQLMA
jgi:predicted nucleotidyltransferase component of viral defense system